jgi:hypothetical protein
VKSPFILKELKMAAHTICDYFSYLPKNRIVGVLPGENSSLELII